MLHASSARPRRHQPSALAFWLRTRGQKPAAKRRWSFCRRPGFTLLEMLLATAVSVLLLGGLYVAVDMQLRHAQAGRDLIEQSTLARSLLTRISRDIRASVTPAAPTPLPPLPSTPGTTGAQPGTSGTSAGTTSPSTTSSTPTNPVLSNAMPATGSAGTSAGSSSSTSPSSQRTTPVFNLGLQGDNTRLTLYVSRLPNDGTWLPNRPAADLRLVTYWLAHNGSRPLGLARFEAPQVTADPGLTLPPPDGSDDGSHVLAEEVRSLSFRYFDGTSWYGTWDGTEPGDDFLTPVGPPLAIEIVLALATPREDGRPERPQDWKYYRHVVAIPAANGLMR